MTERYAWALVALFMTVMYAMELRHGTRMEQLAVNYESAWQMCHNDAMPLLETLRDRLRIF